MPKLPNRKLVILNKKEVIDNLYANSQVNPKKSFKDEFQLLTTNLQPLLSTIKSSQELKSRIKSIISLSNTFLFVKIVF